MKKGLFISVFTVLFALPALSQMEYRPLTVGVKGGVPVTDAFTRSGTGGYSFATKRYTVGPEVDINLPLGLGIEVDALYKRLSFDSSTSTVPLASNQVTANSWEFPILLKIRPGVTHSVRPYIAPGVNFRHVSDVREIRNFFTGTNIQTQTVARPETLRNTFTAGFAIGGGIEFRTPIVRISPEFRYTRWGWENFRDPGNLFSSHDNQAEVLLGITF